MTHNRFTPWLGAVLLAALSACGQTPISSQTNPNVKAEPIQDSRQTIPARDPRVALEGRAQVLEHNQLRLGYPGVSLHTDFHGRYLALNAHSSSDDSHLELRVEGQEPRVVKLGRAPETYVLLEQNEPVERRVSVIHRGETWHGVVTLENLQADTGARLQAPLLPERKILVVGDSVSCGEAIERTADCRKTTRWWNPSQSYSVLAGRALDAQVHLVCYGGRGLTRSWNGKTDEGNAPVFFEQTIADSKPPIAWDHSRYQPDLVLVSLGTNDFSLGIGPLPEREHFVAAYVDFLAHIRAVHPDATLALTEGAIVNDEDDPKRPQKSVLHAYIQEAIERTGDERIHYLPTDHHAGDDCDAHPTKAQHAAMAGQLAGQLSELMGW